MAKKEYRNRKSYYETLKKRYLFHRAGFEPTMKILKKKMSMIEFFRKFKKFIYRNAFYRIEDEMIEKGIIEVSREPGNRYIKLTQKGEIVRKKYFELIKFLE